MAFLMMPFVRSMSILDICEEWSARRLQDQNGDGSSDFFFEESRTSRRACASQPCRVCTRLAALGHRRGSLDQKSLAPRVPSPAHLRAVFERARPSQQLPTAPYGTVQSGARTVRSTTVGRSVARAIAVCVRRSSGAQRGGRKQLAGANKRSRKGRFR